MLKKTFLIIAANLCILLCPAQETSPESPVTGRAKEIWAGINSLSPVNISLGYKHEIATGWFMSYRLFNLQYNSTIQSQRFSNESVRYSISLGAGIERRHRLTDNLLFFHGPEITGGTGKQDFQQFNDSGFWFS